MQIPPIFSALKRNGKKMYEEARAGKTAEDVGLEARPIVVHRLELLPAGDDSALSGLPAFTLSVECGGGTYIRSLIRDIAHKVDSCAVMTSLVRTKQGQFELDNALPKGDWNAENIYGAIEKENAKREAELDAS